MRYIFDHDLHIHSNISLCSKSPEQTPERILQYAKDNGITTICLTDHYWDASIPAPSKFYQTQNFEHISAAKPLPQAEGIRFLFGCETEMNQFMELGMPRSRFDDFDFVIIPTTHFHMKGITIPEDVVTPQEKADFWLKKLNALLDMDLPFHKIGIAHLTCCLVDKVRENTLKTFDSLGEEELRQVFAKAAKVGAGIEINSDDMKFKPEECETILRPYRIAKEVGCKFYMGSDAHRPSALEEAKEVYERIIDLLGLTEDDKFRI